MMADWLVVLVPLAALSIVLLCGFVGCAVPYVTFGGPYVNFGAFDTSDVANVSVRMWFLPQPPPSSPVLPVEVSKTAAQLTDLMNSNSPIDLSAQVAFSGDGVLQCVCIITKNQLGSAPITVPPDNEPPATMSITAGDPGGAEFLLTHHGDDSSLMVISM
jgi:hypothetical protein